MVTGDHARGQTPGVIDPQSVVTSDGQLAELYRAPSQLVASKKTALLDDASRGIVARSPFVLVGTDGADGGLDV